MDFSEVERDDGGDCGSRWTTICKPFAPHCRQVTTPTAAHCLMFDMPDTLCPSLTFNSVKALMASGF